MLCYVDTSERTCFALQTECKFFLSLLRKSNLGVILKSQTMIYAFFNLKGMQVIGGI